MKTLSIEVTNKSHTVIIDILPNIIVRFKMVKWALFGIPFSIVKSEK